MTGLADYPDEVKIQTKRAEFLIEKLITRIPDESEDPKFGINTMDDTVAKGKEARAKRNMSEVRSFVVHRYSESIGFYRPSFVDEMVGSGNGSVAGISLQSNHNQNHNGNRDEGNPEDASLTTADLVE